MYFQLSKKFYRNIGEEFTYKEWGNRYFKLKDIKCMWLYILGFMSLSSMLLISKSKLELIGKLIDHYFWAGVLLIWFVLTYLLIRQYIKRKMENRRFKGMITRKQVT